MENTDILIAAREHVGELFRASNAPHLLYHTFSHTNEIVDAVMKIGRGSKLGESEMEILTLAALFHDTGYTVSVENHETESARLAREFLTLRNYPEEKIAIITACIEATNLSHAPVNLLEEVLCDADLSHLGRKSFFEKSDLLRVEMESHRGAIVSDYEWAKLNSEFIIAHPFRTNYAQMKYDKQREQNILAAQKLLRDLTAEHSKKEEKLSQKKAKEEKSKAPERGIETMFRITSRNHLDLSSIADHKANMMISINTLLIGAVVSLLVRKLDESPHLIIPTFILLGVCLAATIFAILSTRPKVTSGRFTREDIQQKRANLLFFGNFYRMTLDDFDWGMKEMMRDSEYLYGSMTKDIYFLGKVLGRKYLFLRICYDIFMYGMILSILAFSVAILISHGIIPL